MSCVTITRGEGGYVIFIWRMGCATRSKTMRVWYIQLYKEYVIFVWENCMRTFTWIMWCMLNIFYCIYIMHFCICTISYSKHIKFACINYDMIFFKNYITLFMFFYNLTWIDFKHENIIIWNMVETVEMLWVFIKCSAMYEYNYRGISSAR